VEAAMTSRRLSDAIVAAHLIACEEDRKEIARLLIESLELELTRIGGDQKDRRDSTELIESAFELHEKTFGALSPVDARTNP